MKNAEAIYDLLDKNYPTAQIALDYKNPLQLLVATILSAQCTDKTVNKITPALFKKYKTVEDFAGADFDELCRDIKSSGFYRNKAKNIIGAARAIIKIFHSEVPDNMEALLTLPGVARKTANVVLSNAFGKIEGIVVDTHVIRLSRRLGLTTETDPVKIEHDLMEFYDKREWKKLSNLLIFHGRNICDAKKPDCEVCFLKKYCRYVKK